MSLTFLPWLRSGLVDQITTPDGAAGLRNRAVVAFTLLTGARDGAIASLKRKHVDVVDGKVVQDAREVRTKFSKTFTTWFFPVGRNRRMLSHGTVFSRCRAMRRPPPSAW